MTFNDVFGAIVWGLWSLTLFSGSWLSIGACLWFVAIWWADPEVLVKVKAKSPVLRGVFGVFVMSFIGAVLILGIIYEISGIISASKAGADDNQK